MRKKKLYFIFTLSLIIYIIYNLISGANFFVTPPDGKLYYNIAENFINGKGLINTIRDYSIVVPPLYSLMMSFFLFLFKNINLFILFQYIIFGLIPVVLYRTTYFIFKNENIALISVILFIFHPLFLNFGPRYLLIETLYTSFVLLIIFQIVKIYNLKNNKYSLNLFILMMLITLSILLRPHFMFLIPLVFISLVYFYFKKYISIKYLLVIIFIPILLFSIDIVYNYHTYNDKIFLENYSGQNLYIANNPNTKEDFYNSGKLDEFVDSLYFEIKKNNDFSQANNILKEYAINYIISHPVVTFKRILKKMVKLFYKGVNMYDTITIILFILGSLFAVIFQKQNRFLILIILFLIIYFSILSSVGLIVSTQRYRIPIVPIYLIFSSYFIYIIVETILDLFKMLNDRFNF